MNAFAIAMAALVADTNMAVAVMKNKSLPIVQSGFLKIKKWNVGDGAHSRILK